MKKLLTSVVTAGLLFSATAAAEAKSPEAKFTMNPAPKFEMGDFSFQPFGRLHVDTGFFDDDKVDHPDGMNMRRARLGFKGNVSKNWAYKFQMDFGKEDTNLKDAYIAYSGLKAFNIKIGHHKPQQGLENITSANYITFLERSAPTSAFIEDEILGVALYNGGKNYSWHVGFFNDDASATSSDDETKRYLARVSYAPIANKENTLHLGASYSLTSPDAASDTASFSGKFENSLQDAKSVSTGTIANVDDIAVTGLELAAVMGPLSVQGEYMMTDVSRTSGSDLEFDGYYAQASYFLTGESRKYIAKSGKFGQIKLNENFDLDKGTWGAWEVAARYSNLNLTDGTAVTGGEMENVTLGVNWHTTANTRLMLNYVMGDTDTNAVVADDDANVVLLRAQVNF